MLEVEMKFPVAEFGSCEQRLSEWNAKRAEALQEEDHYLSAPDRDFARTDEALRLRRIGKANFVTYKGPKRDKQTKTRTEIEVPLAAGAETADNFIALFKCLGYRPVAVVRKQRRVYRLAREGFALQVCLDEVEDLGRFVELEILASEEQLEPARGVLMQTAAALGLSRSERRSYLELLLDRRGEKSP